MLWLHVEQLQLHSEQFLSIVVSSDFGSYEISVLLSSQSYLHFQLSLREKLWSSAIAFQSPIIMYGPVMSD